MSKQKLNLQPGKTYVTNSGEHITLSEYNEENNYHCFVGSNLFYYGADGFIFEGEHGNPADISHELIQDEEQYVCTCDECCNEWDESGVELIDVLKFKQKSNGTKRKLTLKDYSDDSVEIIFKTKFSKDEPQVTTGIRLSYDAVVMLYNSLEYMLEENQRALH